MAWVYIMEPIGNLNRIYNMRSIVALVTRSYFPQIKMMAISSFIKLKWLICYHNSNSGDECGNNLFIPRTIFIKLGIEEIMTKYRNWSYSYT